MDTWQRQKLENGKFHLKPDQKLQNQSEVFGYVADLATNVPPDDMRLFSLAILRNDIQPAVQLASAQDLSTFSFFQRSSVGQFMTFFSQTIAERTKAGQRQDVEDSAGVTGTPIRNTLIQVTLAMRMLAAMGWWVS